ncbi:MAG: hypothetical protein Q9175_003110 [Cornicularia normoerica]
MIQAFGGGGIPRDELVQHQYDSGLQEFEDGAVWYLGWMPKPRRQRLTSTPLVGLLTGEVVCKTLLDCPDQIAQIIVLSLGFQSLSPTVKYTYHWEYKEVRFFYLLPLLHLET